jgi:ABC-2 type transport system ATP-binding protein
VWSLLDDLRTAGVTIVLATHTMEEAERLADHVVVIDKGRAAAAGSVAELTGHGEPRLVFDAAAGLPVDDLTVRLPAGLVAKETTPGHYVIDGAADAHLVANVTSWCAQQDVLVHRIDTERRTLEDVFLDLTGRPVE